MNVEDNQQQVIKKKLRNPMNDFQLSFKLSNDFFSFFLLTAMIRQPLCFRTDSKMSLITFKAFHVLCPCCISGPLMPFDSARSMRSLPKDLYLLQKNKIRLTEAATSFKS